MKQTNKTDGKTSQEESQATEFSNTWNDYVSHIGRLKWNLSIEADRKELDKVLEQLGELIAKATKVQVDREARELKEVHN